MSEQHFLRGQGLDCFHGSSGHKQCIIQGFTVSGIHTYKPEQKGSLQKFVAGMDVFVSLPTGFGKSLCYIFIY
jgi:ATP-dependent helicase YprA (DUF1998 family)